MRLALVIGVLVTLPAAATDSRREAAENLIRAMRADEQVAQLVERYVRDACRDGGCRVDLTKCLATIDHNRVIDRGQPDGPDGERRRPGRVSSR